MDDLQVFRRAARERGIPDPIVEWWLALARPQVVLHRMGASVITTNAPDAERRWSGWTDSAVPVDTPVVGYYGGNPLLPPDVEWSGFPHFVASLDCAALPSDLPDFPLPDDGHLLFFANKNDPVFSAHDTHGRVVYVPAGTATSERVPLEDEFDAFRCERFLLGCARHWSLPDEEDGTILLDDERSEIYEQYDLDSLTVYAATSGVMSLGGYAAAVQGDPCLVVARGDADPDDWHLLADMRADFGPSRMPGVGFWVIRREDLTERRFDRVKLVMQMAP